MKRFLIILLLSVPFVLEAASDVPNYFPLGIQWKLNNDSGEGGNIITAVQIDNDSLINGYIYHQIGGYWLRQYQRQIYVLDNTLQPATDYLLYDFALEVGDSIYVNLLGKYTKVTATSFVQLADGREAKKIDYEGRGTDIEFLGNEQSGLLNLWELYLNACSSTQLICCTIGDTMLYEKNIGDCDRETKIEVVTPSSIQVSVLRGYLNVASDEPINRVELYTTEGKQVCQSVLSHFPVPYLKNGVYLVAVTTISGETFHTKIVISQ